MNTILLQGDGSIMAVLIGIIVGFILFVLIARWIFKIDKIVSLITYVAASNKVQANIAEKRAIHEGIISGQEAELFWKEPKV